MDNEKKLSRRKFLRTALITAGIIGLSNIDIPEWVEELEEPTIAELIKICSDILNDQESIDLLSETDFEVALGLAFSFLIQHGEEPEQYLIGKKYLQGEVNKIENHRYGFRVHQLMVSLTDRVHIEARNIEPYPTITDIKFNKVNKLLFKLVIRKHLIPLERMNKVQGDWIEVDLQMINEVGEVLGEKERLKLLATVLQWEKENWKNVNMYGVIGTIEKE